MILVGLASTAHQSSVMHAVAITANARTEHVSVFLDGMVVIVLWKDVQEDVLVTVSARSLMLDIGSANASMAGMDRTAQPLKSRSAMILRIMTKV